MNQNDVAEVSTGTAVAVLAGQEIVEQRRNLEAKVHRVVDNGRPFLVQADGKLLGMETFLPNPWYRRGEVAVHDATSFAEYFNRFKDADSVVFGDQVALAFIGVIDYHKAGGEGAARWGRHRVTLHLQQTEPWKEWLEMDKKEMDQGTFGQFLEDRIPDIVQPDGAELVMLARNFEARKDATYNGRIDPDTGSVAIHFAEIVAGVVKDGALSVPRQFVVRLTPFIGAQAYDIVARLRWKVSGSQLRLRYELVRWKQVLEKAFADEREDIQAIVNGPSGESAFFAGPAPAKAAE